MTKERKVILLGGAILLLLGLAYNLAPAVQDLFSIDDTTLLKEEKLSKYRSKIKEMAQLAQLDRSLRSRLARIEKDLLPTKTPALAAVEIQTMIRDIAVRQDAVIKSMRIIDSNSGNDQPYVTIPVEVTLFCTTRQLVEVLYGIETANRLLSVVDLTARAGGSRGPYQVMATMTVAGYMKKDKE